MVRRRMIGGLFNIKTKLVGGVVAIGSRQGLIEHPKEVVDIIEAELPIAIEQSIPLSDQHGTRVSQLVQAAMQILNADHFDSKADQER